MDWKIVTVLILFCVAPVNFVDAVDDGRGHAPFYWQPKLILTLVTPKRRIDTHLVILLRGYKLGITMMALVEGLPERHRLDHLNPLKTSFYTDAYRWYLRHMSLIPTWLYGEGGNYAETVKLWRTRFKFADSFIPEWIQKLLFFIPAEDWQKEKDEFTEFARHAGDAFAKHLRYNDKDKIMPNGYWLNSHISAESVEDDMSTTTTEDIEPLWLISTNPPIRVTTPTSTEPTLVLVVTDLPPGPATTPANHSIYIDPTTTLKPITPPKS